MGISKQSFWRIIKLLLLAYLAICSMLYVFQENLIFFPDQLPTNYQFQFEQPYEELFIETSDGHELNGLLFKADSSEGLIFYLHGNAGSLKRWGNIAPTFTQMGYDVFILDYRGYGKSSGEISSQKQLFSDVQHAYEQMLERYLESEIVVVGFSIGTGMASYLASTNQPKHLVLQAPYYSLVDMLQTYYPVVPIFLLKYKLENYRYLQNCDMPVTLFHGDADEVIPYNSSLRLQEVLEKSDTLITLKGQTHNGINTNPNFVKAFRDIIGEPGQ